MATGMSQEKFAERADVSVSYLAQVESGHRTPSLPMFVHLADVLKLSIMLKER